LPKKRLNLLTKSNQINEKIVKINMHLLTTKVCSTTAASPMEAVAARAATRAMQRKEEAAMALAAMNSQVFEPLELDSIRDEVMTLLLVG
jgi:hypothetical protein